MIACCRTSRSSSRDSEKKSAALLLASSLTSTSRKGALETSLLQESSKSVKSTRALRWALCIYIQGKEADAPPCRPRSLTLEQLWKAPNSTSCKQPLPLDAYCRAELTVFKQAMFVPKDLGILL